MKKFFAIIALLLAFSLVFAGCASADRDDERDDEREEIRDHEEDKNDDKDDKDDQDDDDENKVEIVPPVYENREVWLCVRATTEQWDGSGTGVKEYEYDEFGNKTSENNVTYGGGTKYEYDADGNQIRSQYFLSDGSAGSVMEMTYDKEGRLLSSVSTGSDGKVSSEYSYTYDEAGFVVDEVRKQHYNNTTYHYVITYNADHTEATIQGYKNDEPSGYTEETYNRNGDLLRSDSYASDGSWSSAVECEYDDQGRLTVEWKYSSSELQADYDVIYTYDENGLLINKNVDYYYGYGTTYEYECFEIKVRVN